MWWQTPGSFASRLTISSVLVQRPVEEDDFVLYDSFASGVEAEVAAAALRASGIEAMLRRGSLGELGLPGQTVLLVRPSDLSAARDVLIAADLQDPRNGQDRYDQQTGATHYVSPDFLDAGLATIRYRRRLMWFWFLSYLPVGALVLTVGAESIVVPVITLWMAAGAISSWVSVNSRCPRCGNRFFRRRGFSNPYAGQCLHCGLRLRAADLG
jgi:hypothetical protein